MATDRPAPTGSRSERWPVVDSTADWDTALTTRNSSPSTRVRLPYTTARFIAMVCGWFVFSLGMCLHSASAVVHGWLGDGGEFVRTPKYGIVGARGDWSMKSYVSRKLPSAAWLEVGLMVFVLIGLVAGWVRREFAFYPVQVMTLIGLLWVFGLSVFHSQKGRGPVSARARAAAAAEPAR